MRVKIQHFVDLSLNDFYQIASLRIAVFVVEQNCPYMELDDKDQHAWHMTVSDHERVLGTLRILPPNISYPEVSIGRVASHPDHRDKKLGHLMMKEAMNFIRTHFGPVAVRISAQSHLCGFYEKYGFVVTGKNYLEDGIPHSEMLFTPETSN